MYSYGPHDLLCLCGLVKKKKGVRRRTSEGAEEFWSLWLSALRRSCDEEEEERGLRFTSGTLISYCSYRLEAHQNCAH